MQNQATALHAASNEGHYDVAQLLLEKGAEPNARMDVSMRLSRSVVTTSYNYRD